MKRAILGGIIVIIVMMTSVATNAEAPAQIGLALPPHFAAEVCASRSWNDLHVVWGGVKDLRPSKEIGAQQQKGKEPVMVESQVPLEQVVDAALKQVLAACGMKFAGEGDADALKLSAGIREFYVGVEKGLVTGKSKAVSSLEFVGGRGNSMSTVSIGYETEAKKIRSGDIKQLTQTINELFASIIRRAATAPEMKEFK